MNKIKNAIPAGAQIEPPVRDAWLVRNSIGVLGLTGRFVTVACRVARFGSTFRFGGSLS
jgi:hypothetical protein